MKSIKLICIPPYKGMNFDPKEGHFLVNELMEKMRKRGQLDGVTIDMDDGYDTGHTAESRDEEFLAKITFGMTKKVREYCDTGKYDAIITSGTMGMGFFAARMISKIPVAFGVNSAVHVASLIGDRFSIIEATDPQALIARHNVQLYGLNNKLVSVRSISRSSSYIVKRLRKCKQEERIKDPNIQELLNEIVAECVKAIEEDRAESLILGCTPLQVLQDEIRQRLGEVGYEEIQLIGEFSAAVEMAKAMVNLKLVQSPRAYPSDSLRAKPKFR